MVKKTLLSLAIAATAAGLAGCKTGDEYSVDTTAVTAGSEGSTPSRVTPIFSAANSQLPLNTDFLFATAATTDGTGATADTTPPVTTGINDLAGWSTTATFFIPFNAPLDSDTVVAGQTVHLIELLSKEDNAAIEPLDIASIAAASPAPFAGAGDQVVPGQDYTARYVEMSDGTPAVAVTPLRPLDPKTKYLVALTDGIKDTSGDSVATSAEYELVSGDRGLPSTALQPVRDAVQAWEALSAGYLAQVSQGAISKENLVLTYAFTTDGSSDVLTRYANPALFVADNLPLAAAEDLTDQFAGGQLEDIVARSIAVALAGGNPQDPQQLAAVTPEQIAQVKALDIYPGRVYGAIVDADLSSLAGTDFPVTLKDLAATPTARPVTLVNGAVVDALIEAGSLDPTIELSQVLSDSESAIDGIENGTAPTVSLGASPARFGTGMSTTTRYYQGQIVLPNFLTPATKTSEFTEAGIKGAMAADAAWTANTAVGAVLDAALGNPAGSTPPQDDDGTTNVTYRYPLAQPLTDDNGASVPNVAPILVTVPSEADCGVGAEVPVVIYVHGITGSRGNGAVYSAALASSCIATVAIDQPLHGIAPKTSDSNGESVDNRLLPFHMEADKAADTRSPWAAAIGVQNDPNLDSALGDPIAASERHNNVYQNGVNARLDITYGDNAAGDSGSAFINLFNFARGRDNLRQSVADLLNLNASLSSINAALQSQEDTGTLVQQPVAFDLGRVYVAGHSLGAIVATTFSAVNNNPDVLAGNSNLNEIQGVILANGGANLTKLLENSPSFGPRIVGALGASGIAQGSDSYEKFQYTFQSMIDGIDPANTGLELADTDTPVLSFNMVGGNALPADSSGISYPDGFKGQGLYLPDHTVPNFDYFADGSNPYLGFAPALGLPTFIDTAFAPLAGTQGLTTVLGAEAVTENTDVSTLASPLRVDSRFAAGTHSTFANADDQAVFTEMATQSVRFIKGIYGVTDISVMESN